MVQEKMTNHEQNQSPKCPNQRENMFQILGDLSWWLLVVAFGVFAWLRPHHISGTTGPTAKVEKRARQMKRFGAALAVLGGLAFFMQVIQLVLDHSRGGG